MKLSLVDQIGRWVVGVATVLVLGAIAAPIIVTLVLSVSDSFTFPPTGFSVKWYRSFLDQPQFAEGLKVSLLLATTTAVFALVIGTGVALVLVRTSFRGSGVVSGIMLSPLAIPRIAVGVAFLLLFIRIGVSNAFQELLLLHLVIACPFVIGTVAASLQHVDPTLEQAAMTLGANRFQTFWRVTLPLIRPGLVAGAIFAFVISLDEVTASTFLVDAHTTTFPVVLFAYMERGGIDPTVAAASSVFLLPVSILMAVLIKYVGLGRAFGIWRED